MSHCRGGIADGNSHVAIWPSRAKVRVSENTIWGISSHRGSMLMVGLLVNLRGVISYWYSIWSPNAHVTGTQFLRYQPGTCRSHQVPRAIRAFLIIIVS